MSDDQNLNSTRFTDAAALGLRVFPVKSRAKDPAVRWSQYRTMPATADELSAWNASTFNVGIVCGELVVLDVDSPEAQELVNSLNLPSTPIVRTARGAHLYFKCPEHKIRNGVRIGGVKLDVRGDGGYVVGPGSVHETGVQYEWIVSPNELPFAPFPQQLLELMGHNKRAAPAPTSVEAVLSSGLKGLDRFISAELGRALADIRKAEEGERNDTLFKVSARIARITAAAKVDWNNVAAALADSARKVGLAEREITRTLKSAWDRGSAEPTAWVRVAREHVYLAGQERFYHPESGKDLKTAGFNGQFGSLLLLERQTFSNYLLSTDCVRKVYDLTYEPRDAERFIRRDGLELFNTFRPSSVVAAEGDPGPFVDFLEGLVPDGDERGHLLKMIAFTVRKPGSKLRYALLMRTAMQGVGKSMLTEIWGELLGRHNVRKTTSKELSSDFQSYLRESLLVVCEEMNLGMGSKAYNDLKDMITSDTALVNEKYIRQRTWDAHASFVFLTNLPVPIFIESTDRRIFYIDSPAQRRSPDYYKCFAAWWREHLGVIRGYLDSIDLTDFNAHEAPPMTAAKQALIASSRTELAQEIALAIAERQSIFDRDIVTLDQVLNQFREVARGKKVQVSKALKEAGALPLGQQRIGSAGRASLWVVRNAGYWALTDAEVRAEELQRPSGVFAGLDGTGIEVVHISALGNVPQQ